MLCQAANTLFSGDVKKKLHFGIESKLLKMNFSFERGGKNSVKKRKKSTTHRRRNPNG
jgi:hypothetical protein